MGKRNDYSVTYFLCREMLIRPIHQKDFAYNHDNRWYSRLELYELRCRGILMLTERSRPQHRIHCQRNPSTKMLPNLDETLDYIAINCDQS